MFVMQRYRHRGVWLALGLALLAARASAHPAQITYGPAQITYGAAKVGSGPAHVTGSGAAGGGAPSWVSAMTAAWMLDETSGTRTNLQGTTTRNLVESGGTIGNDTTNKMEGTAAALFTGASARLQTTDATMAVMAAPFTCGVWSRRTSGTITVDVLSVSNLTNSGFELMDQTDNTWLLKLYGGGNLFFGPAVALNIWQHVAFSIGGGNVNIYKDGLSRLSQANAYVASTGTFFGIGGPASYFTGQIDEVWCIGAVISAASICRICSCGIRGEQCACSGATFTSVGRNVTACNSCALPANCSAAAPS